MVHSQTPGLPDRDGSRLPAGLGRMTGNLAQRQTAKIGIKIGSRLRLKASADVTPIGLLAITILVSGILHSARLLVRTAIAEQEN